MKFLHTILLYITLLLAGFGCRSSKEVTTITHSRDSVMTVHERPVAIAIPADSVKGEYTLKFFAQQVQKAKPGAVISAKKSTKLGVGYRIIKTTANPADSTDMGFTVEALTPGKDTTVFVHDTLKVITDKTHVTTTKTVEMSLWEKVKAGWGYGVFSFVLLLLLLLVYKANK